ncbi:hypothetical protein HY409_04305 [Candidatus Gottesmanbacteria bacterium]|nr:hypothetical protein [Candidatus Gottesmanbacteria bacterium]
MLFPIPQKCSATVISVTHLDGAVYNIRFQMTDPNNFSFIAGQHGSFIIEQTIRRNYSFASVPLEIPYLETCVDATPMGPGSTWLMSLKKGDQIALLAPLGRFVVDKESPQKKVFVATGTGISAVRSMILDCLSDKQRVLPRVFPHEYPQGDPFAGDPRPASPAMVSLYWGVRHEENMFWDQQFETLSKVHPNFLFIRIVSQPTGTWQGRVGRVTDFVTKEEANFTQSEFYLCGNREMIYDMRKQLVEKSVPEEQIKSELFY